MPAPLSIAQGFPAHWPHRVFVTKNAAEGVDLEGSA
jgi:hypothetical protein